MWLIRNRFTIETKFPSQPADCFQNLGHVAALEARAKANTWPILDEMVVLLKKLFTDTYNPPQPRSSS
jgi:hypothetical protein